MMSAASFDIASSLQRNVPQGATTETCCDGGDLYAAKFHDRGKGERLPLTAASTGMARKAEICLLTRQGRI